MNYRQQVIETLEIDVEQLKRGLGVEEKDCELICQFLLGYTRQDIATQAIADLTQRPVVTIRETFEQVRGTLKTKRAAEKLSKQARLTGLSAEERDLHDQIKKADERIRDRLSNKIYPAIANIMDTPQESIAGNWTRILNFFHRRQSGYRLNPPRQLNSDNFQGSLGRQVLLPPVSRAVAQLQTEGARFYQQGLYYQALYAFIAAWKREQADYGTGNPEVLIYINNCLVTLHGSGLKARGAASYTIAAVVPVHHNQGQVAAEVLRGIAQCQWQQNLQCFRQLRLDRELDLSGLPFSPAETPSPSGSPLVLQVMIVNDPNRLYDVDSQTAEKLAALAPQLGLMAVIGHYSSEMTQKALSVYAAKGIALINASSTSNQLSQSSSSAQQAFFRLTTPDQTNAIALMDYLAQLPRTPTPQPKTVALIYNANSSYCQSYQTAVRDYLRAHPNRFTLVGVCDRLGEPHERLQPQLEALEAQRADVLVMIPDGGIEPNSFNNVGLISRLTLDQGILAGSATFYQGNVLHWMQERDRRSPSTTAQSSIVACVPWHWHSMVNGCQGANPIGQRFCRIGQHLWGVAQLTWRSATTFDALLMVLKILGQSTCTTSEATLMQLHRYFKVQKKTIPGVTGQLSFDPAGDRLNPPTEIVAVTRDETQRCWTWDLAKFQCANSHR